jgi:class III poly(R)-hydroxyalkanoic acid synthase PhaE subunit
MADDRQYMADFMNLWAGDTKSFMNVWQSSADAWQQVLSASEGGMETQNGQDMFGDWKAWWQDMFSHGAMQKYSDTDAFAEFAASAARTFTEGYSQFTEWMKSAAGNDGADDQHSFIKMQQGIHQKWMEFQEKEIQPLLRIPPIGLTRIYQEKMNQLVEGHNHYHAAVADFQLLLCRPMESSMREMREKLEENNNGNPAEDFQQYYSTWIKTLERHYMDLFNSSEWRTSLGRVVEEAASFRVSKNEIIIDFMQFLPIPTNRDMDDVYKELYTLKKTVKQLVKKNKQQESNAR